jgi:hypothetical protein
MFAHAVKEKRRGTCPVIGPIDQKDILAKSDGFAATPDEEMMKFG